MDRQEYAARVAAAVDRHGVFIQAVGGREGPPFAYTVGLFAVDHPEFIMFGIPLRLAGELLNDLAFSVLRAGMRYSDGDRVQRLTAKGFAWLLTVDDSTEHLLAAHSLRDRRSPAAQHSALPALQVVLSDRNGVWPWEPASEEADLTLLGPPPVYGDGRDHSLPEAAVRRAQGW